GFRSATKVLGYRPWLSSSSRSPTTGPLRSRRFVSTRVRSRLPRRATLTCPNRFDADVVGPRAPGSTPPRRCRTPQADAHAALRREEVAGGGAVRFRSPGARLRPCAPAGAPVVRARRVGSIVARAHTGGRSPRSIQGGDDVDRQAVGGDSGRLAGHPH